MAIALIDADIAVYRVGWACEDEDDEAVVARTLHSFICDVLAFSKDTEAFEAFITGSSSENFRHKYAVTEPYKGNRGGNTKPKWYERIREMLVENYGADVSVGQEADDSIGIRFVELDGEGVICSIDKDFDQFAGAHYNPVKRLNYTVTPEEAQLNFYCQFVEGDKVDNIIGVKGIGKVTARKLMEGKTEVEMFNVAIEQLGSRERAVENGMLLYLRHYPDEIWSPPDETETE